jgi:hypothetical protein
MLFAKYNWNNEVDEMGRTCNTNGEKRNAYKLVLDGKSRGKEAARKTRRRWVDNIRMDLLDCGWGDVDWIGLAQGRDS